MSSDPTRSPERSDGLTTLARASGLPLEHFRADRVDEQLRRACRRAGGLEVAGLARAAAADSGLLAREPLHRTLALDGVLLLGRSERLTAPAHLGLHQIAPHAYGRLS